MVDRERFIDDGKSRVLTQYRESLRFLRLLEFGLSSIVDVVEMIESIPTFFDIETAVGDQLTIIGRRLGWPRCHCVCSIAPVFGFKCDNDPNIVGFCDEGSVWAACQPAGLSTICFDDDEVYRGYVLARRFQALQEYDIDALQIAARSIWGDEANAINMGAGRAAVSAGRALSSRELQELPLAFRVLPFAPGIRTYFDAATGPTFGFGEGWAGFCENAQWFCPTPINPYEC